MIKSNSLPFLIKTKRLLIRPHKVGDAPLLNQAILDSFEELHVWMDWAATPQTMENTISYIEFSQKCWKEEYPKELPLLIFDLEEKSLIDSTGFHEINWKVPRFEIGYWSNVHHSGKGFITEAVNALTQHAFLPGRLVALQYIVISGIVKVQLYQNG